MYPGISWSGPGYLRFQNVPTEHLQRQDGRCQIAWNVPWGGYCLVALIVPGTSAEAYWPRIAFDHRDGAPIHASFVFNYFVALIHIKIPWFSLTALGLPI